MRAKSVQTIIPEPIVVAGGAAAGDDLLTKEWLIANRLGAYASATVCGTNTRRYHGLLIAATNPPAGRVLALSNVLDQFVLPGRKGTGTSRGDEPVPSSTETVFDLATFEFDGAVRPDGRGNLVEFRNDVAATFVYRCGPVELIKEIVLAESANAVAVRYRLISGPGGRLRLRPFVALRDYHALRQAEGSQHITFYQYHNGIRVEDRSTGERGLHLAVSGSPASGPGDAPLPAPAFRTEPQWWYKFRYRGDLDRGQDGHEDLYSPGWFDCELSSGRAVQFVASLDDPVEVAFDAVVEQKRRRAEARAAAVADGDETTRRLAVATDAFVVTRRRPNAQPGRTILAGFPWFADWGRDAMVALPGLLLETGRLRTAREVLETFAEAVDGGMVPNCFDERGGSAHYNSIDASLWFVVAVDRYLDAGGEEAAWSGSLASAVEKVLKGYHDGTRFGIRADADELLTGGDERTQLTWMDAQIAGEPVTPRQGKAVEVNALWHACLRIAARRFSGETADAFAALAERVGAAFEAAFWNPSAGCLFDCVRGEEKDGSIRPNQVIAVALPGCPLSPERQRSIVEVVRRELLTPYGLRTLSANDPRYRPRYGVSWESRDRSYHQGTAWPWLMGSMVEAHLRAQDFSPAARAEASEWLAPFDAHLRRAGLGFISEIFDGSLPHNPAGCIAQAWSVAEVLRAKRLIARGRP